MPKRPTLNAFKEKIWQDYFGQYNYQEIMSLRVVYNQGYRNDQTRNAAAVYIAFWRKVRELANA